MGVGRLDIGEGIGDAKVFNPNPAIQMYGQMLAQRKAKQETENKYLGDVLAKGYDPSTLRNDADRASYIKQYNTIKQDAINIANEKDPTKKALGLAQVRQRLGDLGNYAEQSKKQGLQEHAWAQSYMTNPNNWDDTAIEAYRKSKESELNTPETIKDFTTLQRRIDHDKVDKLYSDHRTLLTKNLQFDNGVQTPGQEAGKKGVYVVQSRGLPMDGEQGAFENTLHWATAHPDVIKSLEARYPNIQAETPQATTAAQLRQYMIDRGDEKGIYERTKPTFKAEYKPEKPQEWTKLQKWNLEHYGNPSGPEGGEGVVGAPKDQPIYYADGKGRVDTKGYIGVNSAPINMVGQKAYNLSTGELDATPLPSTDVQLVGITNTPFITGNYKSGNKSVKGAIAQQGFIDKHPKDVEWRPTLHIQMKNPEDPDGPMIDKLIPTDGIPKNLPKATLKALSGFKPYTKQTTPAGTPLKNKSKKAATDYGL